MRRDVRILLGTVLLGAGVQWGPSLPVALSGLEVFRLTHVDVRGLRFLDADEAHATLAIDSRTSVWTDLAVLEERLLAHPLVREVEILRRPPHGVRVVVRERQPIALAPTPVLEPVDAEGRRLPLDPAEHRLDLPIIATDRRLPDGASMFPEDVRELAGELSHLMNADTTFLQRVSSVRLGDDGTIVARWTEPAVEFLLPERPSPARLREGLGALANAIARTPGSVPKQIDLRFADQVVVRRSGN